MRNSEQRMTRPGWSGLMVTLAVFAALLNPAHAPCQSTTGWQAFDGSLFAFPYPQGWTAKKSSDQYVVLSSPSGYPSISVEYTTAFRDPETLLASEKSDLEKLARDQKMNISVRALSGGPRGGTELSADLWGNGAPLSATALAVAVG